MQKLRLLFEVSPWFILLCVIAGAAYAFILYQKQSPWSKRTNYLLGGLRFLLVSLLCFLLLGPFIKQIKNTFEHPVYVFAIDNSLSVKEVNDSTQINNILSNVGEVAEGLKEEKFEVEFRTFEQSHLEKPINISFDHQVTDINNLLKNIQSDYEGRNLAGVILLSDGIYNHGVSPTFVNYNFPIHSVALGDTIPKKDINLRAVNYNKISYQGNKFPIVAEVIHNGFPNEKIEVSIIHNDKVLTSKTVKTATSNDILQIQFLLDANTKGMQHYVVRATPKVGEFTTENNVKHAYIDIIEGKEKILIAALTPHPDIKAISSTLEKNKNYEINLYIPGIHKKPLPADLNQYGLVIFHQLPGINSPEASYFEKLINEANAAWFIVGNQSDITSFNRLNGIVNVQAVRGEKDRVIPSLNNSFDLFKLSSELKSLLPKLNPVTVPFGRYVFQASNNILLYQQVGSITTNKPLLAFREEGTKKLAVLMGEGIWQWRIQEYALNSKQVVFDELISKVVQFLASKEDKRKFKVYPVKGEFNNTEPVIFETEIYNDIYEPIYGQKINLIITDEENRQTQYSYVTNEINTQYRISGLQQGVYSYVASTNVNGNAYQNKGEFTINKLQLESLNLTANHHLLKKLSAQTNGIFYLPGQLMQLKEFLSNKEINSVIYSDEQYLPIIDLKWLFFLLLALISVEWFTRKYSGSY